MGPEQLFKVIQEHWAVVMTAPAAFVAALILGCGFGWLAAWIILKQRLDHYKERVDHFKDILAGQKSSNVQGREEVRPPLSEPKPLEKRFTAYDVEQRLRAIDQLYGLLGGNVREASADGERLNKSLADKAPGNTIAAELEKYADATEEVLKNYFETAGKFMVFHDIFHDATALVWNPFDLVSSAKNLAAEIKSLEQQNANVPLFLRNNKFMAEFNSATSGRFSRWINEKQQLLEKKRREYEDAPVYPR